VSCTNANALWGARVNATHEGLRPDDIHLVMLPLFHTNAQAYSILACLWAGATAVVQPRFSASRFWSVANEERCTWTSLMPFLTRALSHHPVPESHHFRLWGNAVAEPPTDALFGVRCMGWWGMTETITQGILSTHDQPAEPMSIGRPAPEYEIRVTDALGRPCQPGDTGDLAIRGVRGLSLFAEYLHNPQATADSFDEHGFFLTGDKIRVGERGELYFGDRSKDMLKVGGENVSASEIERVVITVAGVEETAVVARRHPMLDEVPVAFVRTLLTDADEREALIAAVQATCTRDLADFKRPREVRLIDDFPRSTLEKIAKAQLRAMLEEGD
jgi:crotonobetaine/carnitine-CoA ligase